MLLENNPLQGGKSNSTSHQPALRHLIDYYFPLTAQLQGFYSLHNLDNATGKRSTCRCCSFCCYWKSVLYENTKPDTKKNQIWKKGLKDSQITITNQVYTLETGFVRQNWNRNKWLSWIPLKSYSKHQESAIIRKLCLQWISMETHLFCYFTNTAGILARFTSHH